MGVYIVPNMRLIPQDMNMACWWASALMLATWGMQRRDPFEVDHPLYHRDLSSMHTANHGIPWAQMLSFARELGLTSIPPLQHAPTPEELVDLLVRYGPLWCDGRQLSPSGSLMGNGHAVVIAGVITGPKAAVLIYDPWPPRKGAIYWRPATLLSSMFVVGNPLRTVSILHFPH